MQDIHKDSIRRTVRRRYAQVAEGASGASRLCSTSCCQPEAEASSCGAGLDSAVYSAEDLRSAPQGADLGLGCGNPLSLADIKPGEAVLDLGSGGGLDCFLAAKQAGRDGRVIGVDMTPEMVTRARATADAEGVGNVEFRLGELENLPVADNSVDVVISNCVVNLSPDKPRVLAEAFRVLKPGGRLAIMDMVAKVELPPAIRNDPDLLCGCLAGAALESDLEAMFGKAGFVRTTVSFLNKGLPEGEGPITAENIRRFVSSAAIEAYKPAQANCCSL